MISAEVGLFDEAAEALTKTHGPVDLVSETFDFDFTHYYDAQMGSPLFRKFVAFDRPVKPDVLVEAKLESNNLEQAFACSAAAPAARPINIDPGYLTCAKLVLASMKNFSHRIYLGRGVYGEVTLMYKQGRWRPLEWTFPDFTSPRYWEFLDSVRERLKQQLLQKPQEPRT